MWMVFGLTGLDLTKHENAVSLSVLKLIPKRNHTGILPPTSSVVCFRITKTSLNMFQIEGNIFFKNYLAGRAKHFYLIKICSSEFLNVLVELLSGSRA